MTRKDLFQHLPENFGDELKTLCDQNRITAYRLALWSNTDTGYIGKVFKGKVRPRIETRQKIIQALQAQDIDTSRLEGYLQPVELRKSPKDDKSVHQTSQPDQAATSPSATDREIHHQADPKLEALVKDVREKIKRRIQYQCGIMRILDVSYRIDLDSIYTEVNILEKVTSKSYQELETLVKKCQPKDFDRLGYEGISSDRIPALEAVKNHQKLFVLGKPGSGKTTFLKYLANQCNHNQLNSHLVPIFMVLRKLDRLEGESSLLASIERELGLVGVSAQDLKYLLSHGRVFLLLDGLDEVESKKSRSLIDDIDTFLYMFPDVHCVMTCRIAAQEYIFSEFMTVEIADFSQKQIESFVEKWFTKRFPDQAQDVISGFHQKLDTDKPSKELANNPLLLTLLCLVFEDLQKFPHRRSMLYKKGLESLMNKWDSQRSIERSEVYMDLDIAQKQDLLSYLAYTTFSQGHIFSEQENIEILISNYICSFASTHIDKRKLRIDSKAILKSIEVQHGLLVERAQGIYSFSHLTFQEYFTAQYITENPDLLTQNLEFLINQITNKQWREVFLLTAEMLPNSDYFLSLMKQNVDAIVAEDRDIQTLLIWLKQKTDSIEHPYKPAAVRATYIEPILDDYLGESSCKDRSGVIDISIDSLLEGDIALTTGHNLQNLYTMKKLQGLNYGLDRSIDQRFDQDFLFPFKPGDYDDRIGYLVQAKFRSPTTILDDALAFLNKHHLDFKLELALQQLKNQLPLNFNAVALQEWFSTEEGEIWKTQLRTVIIQYRNIGHEWQFSDSQQQLLKDYYNANLLLIQCLKESCSISQKVKQHIEETLLLPLTEL